jgi:hypothetical protein
MGAPSETDMAPCGKKKLSAPLATISTSAFAGATNNNETNKVMLKR